MIVLFINPMFEWELALIAHPVAFSEIIVKLIMKTQSDFTINETSLNVALFPVNIISLLMVIVDAVIFEKSPSNVNSFVDTLSNVPFSSKKQSNLSGVTTFDSLALISRVAALLVLSVSISFSVLAVAFNAIMPAPITSQ